MSDVLVKGHVGDDQFRHSVWQDVTALADQHNEPGRFTALIGYEWTSLAYNLHRVVIFQDSAEKAGSIIPFTQYDSPDSEQLWSFFDGYTQQTGSNVLAIPHNGNLSLGTMFALQDAKGTQLSKQYASTCSRWEPLYEVTQIKGDGETHPIFSPTDEFADYETWDKVSKASLAAKEKYRKRSNYTDYIGNPELAVVWTDPDFNKNELAFYYVRVLEIPTPRWTAYDVKYFGLKDITEEVPMVTQERAYTSPIWYSPDRYRNPSY